MSSIKLFLLEVVRVYITLFPCLLTDESGYRYLLNSKLKPVSVQSLEVNQSCLSKLFMI